MPSDYDMRKTGDFIADTALESKHLDINMSMNLPPIVEVWVPTKAVYNEVMIELKDNPRFRVFKGSIVNSSASVMIAADNSFGQMDGGVDGIMNTRLSAFDATERFQDRLKRVLAAGWSGELPVGQAVVVETTHPQHTHLVYAPTMRVPQDCSETANAYLALRGALLACAKHPEISGTVVCTPLLCTGAGSMPVAKACRQMAEAFNSLAIDLFSHTSDWPLYHRHHRLLVYGPPSEIPRYDGPQ
jgi:O-acetyl-ADP-ribose deacetylase (regulator of RNase III)